MADKRIVDDPVRLQRLLDDSMKLEKYRKAGKMYRDGFNQRQIAKESKLSFRDISEAIQLEVAGLLQNHDALANAAAKAQPRPKTDEELNIELLRALSATEKHAEAARLFSEGKRPDEVAYMLALALKEVNQLYLDYLASRGLHELGSLAVAGGDKTIRQLAKIKRVIDSRGQLTVDDVAKYIMFAETLFGAGKTKENLDQEVNELRKEKERITRFIEENRQITAELESKRSEMAALRKEEERIKQDCPQASAAVVAEQKAKSILVGGYYYSGNNKEEDGALKTFCAMFDTLISAIRSNPDSMLALILPERYLRANYTPTARANLIRMVYPAYLQLVASKIAQEVYS